MCDLEVLRGNIQWWNLQLCEGGGNFHKALPLGKNNSLSPANIFYLVTGKENSSVQWQTAWVGRWGHAEHCWIASLCLLPAQPSALLVLPPSKGRCFCSNKREAVGARSLNCLGSSQLSGLALLLPLQSALSSFLQSKCQFCLHCQEALKPRKKMPQMTPGVELVPKSRVPGNTTASAKDCTDS